ncbi:MAG: dockerin type I domain-containing protein, partial [Candidatus Methanoperedens sp.]|nr:dockerin type I domain-containing protein [Candidatus Methanoperedens sp.]
AGSKTVPVNQAGYEVEWTLNQKPVIGDISLMSAMGSLSTQGIKSVYKPGSMVPIKFTVSEHGNRVVDKSVSVLVFDPNGREVFSAIYGSGSKSVRIDEDGRYIANFKSTKNDLPGTYRIEVRFDSQRKNQDFGKGIYLLDQKVTYFANRGPVGLKASRQDETFTYEWKLDGRVIGTGRELNWVPDAPGIYNIQLFVTKNKNKIDTEGYNIIVNAEADANGDDAVNVLDLSLLGLNWGKKIQDSDFEDGADVNGDGVVDIFDAVKIGKRWS